ncbi:hypothetical protein OG21DRAFT_1594896 [Imleria badia]|nr:hypothetical protein OG21DRAFT_1594896 [Imleria badia]
MEYDYFSIDAILAENQKIQCTFKIDVPGMGHLGGGSDKDIKALTKVPLPMWLAYIFLYSDWADVATPVAFGTRVRNALKAEPRSVKLSSLVGAGGLWYGFGKMIAEILTEEQGLELETVLTQTLRGRLTEVIDQAQHFAALGPAGGGGTSNDVTQSFREGLEGTERELFLLAQESTRRTKRWHEGSDKASR